MTQLDLLLSSASSNEVIPQVSVCPKTIPSWSKSINKKSPKTLSFSFIVIFPEGRVYTEDDICECFRRFGVVKGITFCKADKCQAFIVMHNDYDLFGQKPDSSVDRLFEDTEGFVNVGDDIWKLVRLEDKSQAVCSAAKTTYDGESPLRPHRLEKAVDSCTLNNIYVNFLNEYLNRTETNTAISSRSSICSDNCATPTTSRMSVFTATDRLSSISSTTTLVCPTSVTDVRVDDNSVTSVQTGYLSLAPPYHILPDTPYFRNATIIPPPVGGGRELSVLQRIINRYVESMKVHDEIQRRETEYFHPASIMYDDESTIREDEILSNYSNQNYNHNQYNSHIDMYNMDGLGTHPFHMIGNF